LGRNEKKKKKKKKLKSERIIDFFYEKQHFFYLLEEEIKEIKVNFLENNYWRFFLFLRIAFKNNNNCRCCCDKLLKLNKASRI